ncbi:MAG: hypothetical protein FJZ01_28145 [Candidatus Sericytochromatia bacterium]|nr:hypothetical protein [Candidatus Tanganyikabacteria bacterium]
MGQLAGNRDPGLSDAIRALGGAQTRDTFGLEMVVNSDEFAEAIKRQFHLVAGEGAAKALVLRAKLALGGVLHYVGRVLKGLAANGTIGNPENLTVRLCIGGRASLLYRTLFGDQNPLERLLVAASDGIVAQAPLIFTSEPKFEVAYGLLVPQTGAAALDLSQPSPWLPPGESLSVGRSAIGPDGDIRVLDPEQVWRVSRLDGLGGYLRMLAEHAGVNLELASDTKLHQDLVGRINARLSDLKERLRHEIRNGGGAGRSSETHAVEPVFVIALRELLQLVSENRIRIRG